MAHFKLPSWLRGGTRKIPEVEKDIVWKKLPARDGFMYQYVEAETGRPAFPGKFRFASHFYNGIAIVDSPSGFGYTFIDKYGERIRQVEFGDVGIPEADGWIRTKHHYETSWTWFNIRTGEFSFKRSVRQRRASGGV